MSEEPLEPIEGRQQPAPAPVPVPTPVKPVGGTRAAIIWTFTVVGILLLVFLVIFIMQNEEHVTVRFLGFQGELAQGVAMLFAAIGGALVVAIVGAVRIIQLRSRARSADKAIAATENGY